MTTNPTTGAKEKQVCERWSYRFYVGKGLGRKRVSGVGTVSKTETKKLADAHQRRCQQEEAGLVARQVDVDALAVDAVLPAFARRLASEKGDTELHVTKTVNRIRKLLAGAGIKSADQITKDKILAELVKLKDGGLHVSTVNRYLTLVKSMTRWLAVEEKLPADPLALLGKLPTKRTEPSRIRRELSQEELQWLLTTAWQSPRRQRGLSGRDRAALYLTAVTTGLRVGDLCHLRPADFVLDGPYIDVAAKWTKNGIARQQPLSIAAATMLKSYLADKPAKEVIWSKKALEYDSAKLIRNDLADAQKAWQAAQQAQGQARSDDNDFLAYEDSKGRYADFHALKHTFLSQVHRGGASAKTLQELAGHKTLFLAINVYSHVNADEKAKAVNALPALELPAAK